ncbi:TrbC/VirB2 family protein [Mameliella sp. CS4]|uniref:TrbC/VirB2 family protein n=1 Tax=Mameliella sp. CS4 TaxID=2862329 RepID=UPI00351D69F8
MTSKPSLVALGAMALIVMAGPALAQSIDLSPVQTLLQGIVDAITGPLGIVIGTLALIGVFLSCQLRTSPPTPNASGVGHKGLYSM